jgi:regulator of sigma D
MKSLIASSELMLDITESYRSEEVLEHFQLLQSELERIGENLASRFDIEDTLVFKYLDLTGRNKDFTELTKASY